MEKKSTEQWINYVLDLTDFMTEHPGGLKAIKNYVYKDITNIIFQVFPHQKQPTLHKLMIYQVGTIPEDQVTNARSKADKSVSQNDRPKQKKKVCFNPDREKMTMSINPNRNQKHPMTGSLNRSTNHTRQRDNARESTHKSNASKSKGKKQEFLTSIRVINDQKEKTYDDYFQENQQKIKQKQRAVTQLLRRDRKERSVHGSCSFVDNELDEEKPNFRVPVLCVKHMNKHY